MSSTDPGMKWALAGFGADEWLCSEHPINKDQLVKLRSVVPPAADDPWYVHSYPVPREAWPAVAGILECAPLDPEVEYFIEGSTAWSCSLD
ncbi:hypothetical protein G5C51_05060 [Streptomyces sp. A7024]|uniref:Uncharacterized protein n=1 Tax=Streptomyces coryli TaxID=1128680 RepID=A0A6G4TTG4_9ACTN|nr:hypothetical protein [Streptomyces coryli]NGN63275.1 hypothetical protein [Streptomyces coryli]